jgi:endothelin-converting enzyme/putative endopeptidase
MKPHLYAMKKPLFGRPKTYNEGMRILVSLCLLASLAIAQKSPGFDPAALDRKADPCADFYQFACGAWIAANPVPADQSRWGRFDALQERNRDILKQLVETAANQTAGRSAIDQKIGDFYAACMDEKTINGRGAAPLKPDLDRIAAINSKTGIPDVVAHLHRTGTTPFFRFSSSPDAKNSTQMIADLDQGGLGLPDRDYYFKTDEKSAETRKQYLAHVQKMFELLGVAPADAAKKAQAVMDMETALAKGSLDRVARRDPEKLYHKMPVKDLVALDAGFDWARFFRAAGAPRFQSLNVDVPDFVKALDSVIMTASLEDLKTYLTWNLLRDTSQVLSAPFEEENFNFYSKTLRGTKEMRARWKRCVDLTDSQLPDALGRKFVEKTLGPEGTRRTREMVEEIEKAMAADLQSLDWMTPATKEQALLKLRGVLNKIGTKEDWLTYSNVKIARDDIYGDAERTSLFDLRTGAPKTLPAYVGVETFPVVVENDIVKLEVE